MIRPPELEAKVLDIVDRVIRRQPVEDSLVELKTAWIEPQKAARRIAGHANAAHGQPIIWIVGVDENGGRVVGAAKTDLANWYPAVSSRFDEVAPDLLLDLSISYEEQTIVALLFDTSRVPYVVKVPNGQNVHREVPWRTGTGIDSARRQDLLRLLSPLQKYPKVEIVETMLELFDPKTLGTSDSSGLLVVRILIAPQGSEPLVFPLYKLSARLTHPSCTEPILLEHVTFTEFLNSSNLAVSRHVAQFSGPEVAVLNWPIPNMGHTVSALHNEKGLTATLSFRAVDPEIEIVANFKMCGPQALQNGRIWRLVGPLGESEIRISPIQRSE